MVAIRLNPKLYAPRSRLVGGWALVEIRRSRIGARLRQRRATEALASDAALVRIARSAHDPASTTRGRAARRASLPAARRAALSEATRATTPGGRGAATTPGTAAPGAG